MVNYVIVDRNIINFRRNGKLLVITTTGAKQFELINGKLLCKFQWYPKVHSKCQNQLTRRNIFKMKY